MTTSSRVVRKSLACEEDILFGRGKVTQSRNGADYELTKVRHITPVDTIEERDALDTTKFLYCTVAGVPYSWDGHAWVPSQSLASAAAVKASSFAVGTLISTAGYYSAGDGGHADYIVQAPKTVDEFGDLTLANGNVAILLASAEQRVNSLQYGARADWDGLTGSDDTAALQAMLVNWDAVTVLGASLLTSTLALKDNQDLQILGSLSRDPASPAFDMLVGDGVKNVKVVGGLIDGSALLDESVADNRFCGLRFWDSSTTTPCEDIYIANVSVTRTTSGEIQAEGNRGAITLEDTVRGTVKHCHAYNNRATSILIQGAANADCKVLNCTLRDNDTIGSGISGNAHRNLLVQGNHVYRTKYTPISVNGKNAVIDGNTVHDGPNNYAGITVGHTSIESNTSGTIVSNNLVHDCGTELTQVAGIVVMNSDDVVLTGNTIRDNSSVGIRFLGVPVDAIGHCKVSGNIINSNGGIGIRIDWGVNIDIDGNTILGNASTGIYIDGIQNDSGSNIDDIYVRNNLIKDNGLSTGNAGLIVTEPTTGTVTVKSRSNVFEGDGANVQAKGMWAAGANVIIEVGENDFNSSYTESLAYYSTSGGTFKFKGRKGENLTFVTSLQNGWSAAASLGYWKDSEGTVHLQGAATGGTVSAVAFSLPIGYRPAATQNFATLANNAFAFCSVSSSGDVTLYSSNNSHYLNNVSFKAVAEDAS